jgi:hypothetical protein
MDSSVGSVRMTIMKRKLRLNRETIRNLANLEMQDAKGGAAGSYPATCMSCEQRTGCTANCSATCNFSCGGTCIYTCFAC